MKVYNLNSSQTFRMLHGTPIEKEILLTELYGSNDFYSYEIIKNRNNGIPQRHVTLIIHGNKHINKINHQLRSIDINKEYEYEYQKK